MSHLSDSRPVRQQPMDILIATFVCVAIVLLGGLALAPLVALVFGIGFFSGLALWLARPGGITWDRLKVPYAVAILAYIIHRIDEEVSAFVPAMEELTGQRAVDVVSPTSILLVILSLGWMLSPLLVRLGHPLGQFGAWSLFATFALVEPWHFIFPLLTAEPYGYFPGMVTAPIIIAAGLWGLSRMWQDSGRQAGDQRPSDM